MATLFMDVQARGGAAVQKDMQQLFAKDKDAGERTAIDEEVKKQAADPLNGYDPYVVAQHGIVSWSYPEPLTVDLDTDDRGNRVPRVRAIDDLDEDAVRWFATEIMRLTKPALFQTDAEAAADRKNG